MRIIRLVEPSAPALPARKRVAAYARVSGGKDEQLHSLSAQVSRYSELIQRRGDWAYVGVYADEPATGTKDTRPEFRRLVDDCRAGLIDMVITKSISRFARNTVTMLETVRELKLIGVDVFFERENIHSLSGDGELMLTILASFAQEESRSASENCKWRIKKRFERGETVGFVGMYGYGFVDGEIVVNDKQAAVVRRIFDLYIGDGSEDDGLGTGQIAQRLNEEGIPAYLGGHWSGHTVRVLLRNEKLTGNALLQKRYSDDHLTKKQKLNRGEKPQWYAEGTHPAIVSMEDFEAAQRIRLARAAKYKAEDRVRQVYPFTGIVVCGGCGKNYKRCKNAARFNWQCGTFLQEGKAACAAKQIPEETLKAVSAEVLGLDEFDETVFKNSISEMRVPAANALAFTFFDGHVVERTWQDRSRRESWTAEMREAARQKALAQHGKGTL